MFPTKGDRIIAYIMVNQPEDVKAMLKASGYAYPDSTVGVQHAFLKAIKDDPAFRANLVTYATEKARTRGKMNFVSQPAMTAGFVSQPAMTMGFVSQPQSMLNIVTIAPPTGSGSITTDTLATNNTATTNTTKTSFWDKLGSAFTADTIKTVVNTGLGAVSTKLQSNANTKSEENALELERIRLAQIEAQNAGKGIVTGLSTGAIVAIGLAGLLIIGLIIYAVKKKK